MSDHVLPWDWYEGKVPESVVLGEKVYIESSYSFLRFRSRLNPAITIGEGTSIYLGTMFDLGPEASVEIGQYCILSGPQILVDGRLEIGDYALMGWNLVISDSRRFDLDPENRRAQLRAIAAHPERVPDLVGESHPVKIGSNAWVSFDVVIEPGVTIGEGAVVRARSVVTEDVAPYTIVSGSPAQLVSAVRPSGEGR